MGFASAAGAGSAGAGAGAAGAGFLKPRPRRGFVGVDAAAGAGAAGLDAADGAGAAGAGTEAGAGVGRFRPRPRRGFASGSVAGGAAGTTGCVAWVSLASEPVAEGVRRVFLDSGMRMETSGSSFLPKMGVTGLSGVAAPAAVEGTGVDGVTAAGDGGDGGAAGMGMGPDGGFATGEVTEVGADAETGFRPRVGPVFRRTFEASDGCGEVPSPASHSNRNITVPKRIMSLLLSALVVMR